MKQLSGTIISTKMTGTVVVAVESFKTRRLYGKKLKVVKKYMADNPSNTYHEGQRVLLKEVRPLSKTKRWQVVEAVK